MNCETCGGILNYSEIQKETTESCDDIAYEKSEKLFALYRCEDCDRVWKMPIETIKNKKV